MKVSRLGCDPSNSAWFHTCARDNTTISQAEGNEESSTVWADATDAKYVTLSVAYTCLAPKGEGRGKREGDREGLLSFSVPRTPTPLFAPTRLCYRYQTYRRLLLFARLGVVCVLNDNAVTMGALSPLTENLKWCRVTCYWCLHRGWTHSHTDVTQTFFMPFSIRITWLLISTERW